MKRTITAMLILNFFLLSCEKENQSATDIKLYGQWNWKSYTPASPVNTLTPQNTGIQETLIFQSDHTWSKTQNGVTIRTGVYTTATSKSNSGENINSLKYNNSKNGSDTTEYYKIYNDTTLVFSHDFAGSTGSASRTYVKSK